MNHIAELVAFAEANREALETLRPECEIDIFCGVFSGDGAQGGFTFAPALSKRLSDLQLAVAFDVY